MAVKGKALGYLLGAIAAASYGLNPTFALPLYADGMNPDSVLLFRTGIACDVKDGNDFRENRKFAVR